MVEINYRVEIQFQDEKPITVPKDPIIQFKGQTYIKLRPTSLPIVQLIHGGKVAKNASLSSSTTLKQLIKARNERYNGQMPPEENQEELFDDQEPVPGSKRPFRPLEEEQGITLQIDCDGTSIDCLMMGQRPSRTDFTFLSKANQIEASVKAMRLTSTQDLNMPTRAYTSKDGKKANQE